MYNIYRCDRAGRTGGGVAFFIKNTLRSYRVEFSDKFGDLETCLVAVVHNKHKLFLGAVYKPSVTDTHLLKPLRDFLKYVSKKSGKHIILGDFNLPDVNWAALSAPNGGRQFDFMQSFVKLGFSQVVTQPTRGNNTLDLIFSNDQNLIFNVTVNTPFNTSDHRIISANISVPAVLATPRYRNLWHSGNYSEIVNSMITVNWNSVFYNCNDLSSMVDDFVNICSSTISDHVPRKLIKHKVKQSHALKLALRQKTRLHKLHKQYNSSESLKNYKLATDRVNKLLFEEAEIAEKSLLSNPSVKRFYNYVNGKLRSRDGYDAVTEGSSFISDDRKAQLFGMQFSSVFTRDNGILMDFGDRHVQSTLNDAVFTHLNVTSAIKNLLCKTSSGIDGLPSIFFKKCLECLVEPLSLIFQRSFETSEIPQSWRDAIVIPVYKGKGNKSDVANYRPISMTPVVCRVMEVILKNCLVNHLVRNNLISNVQHGFLSKRSTLTNLLSCLNNWVECIDLRSSVDVMYLDIAKAFDSVSHSKLLHKISKYGISGNFFAWIAAFLKDRRQAVQVNDSRSEFASVTSGVPQGSVLGPILFLIYINDLAGTLRDCSICIFADDSKIYFKADTMEDTVKIQRDIDRIFQWCNDWQLSIAAAKCNILHVGRTNIRTVYSMGHSVIPLASNIRDLGVIVSEDLTFSNHICKMCSTAMQRVNLIFRAFTTRDSDILLKTFITYVRPLVEYNAPVWSPFLLRDIKLIEKVQRNFTRRIYGLENLSYKQRLDALSLHTLESRRVVFDLVEVFKIVKGISYLQFNDFFVYKSDARTRGHNLQLRMRRIPRLELCKQFFAFRVVNIWNSLDQNVVNLRSVEKFKSSLNPESLLRFCKLEFD